MARLGQVKSEG